MTNKSESVRGIRHGARGARWCLGIVVTIISAACAPSPEPTPEPTHQTVEYYRNNAAAREARLAECANDPGALRDTPDCVNARQAALQSTRSLRDLPPIGLSDPDPSEDGRSRQPGTVDKPPKDSSSR